MDIMFVSFYFTGISTIDETGKIVTKAAKNGRNRLTVLVKKITFCNQYHRG